MGSVLKLHVCIRYCEGVGGMVTLYRDFRGDDEACLHAYIQLFVWVVCS